MAGTLDETDYGSLRERVLSDQSALAEFSEEIPTTIAVVRLPRDTGIEEVCDEWMPELGMPERALKEFWEYRSGYRTNSAVDNPTNRAFEDALLGPRYREYLSTNAEAKKALRMIVRRLRRGEDITLVCFEESGKRCHRHILVEKIQQMLAAKESEKFTFTVPESAN